MAFNQKVTALLKQNEMKKSELASICGLAYSTLDSKLKRDTETDRLLTYFRIADVLGVSLEELVFDEKEKGKALSAEEKKVLRLYSQLDSRGRGAVLALLEREAEASGK